MFETGIEKDTIELLAANLRPELIEELGRLTLGRFDLYAELGEHKHITVPGRRAAAAMVTACKCGGKWKELLQLLIETDGSVFMGRKVEFRGLENLFESLTRSGYVYDFRRRRLLKFNEDIDALQNWGSLRPGRSYPITVVSLDVVDSSRYARRYGNKTVKKVLQRLRDFLAERLRTYDGRMWAWHGDGGLVAFAFEGQQLRAVQFALDVQRTLPILNGEIFSILEEGVEMRVGISCGEVVYADDPSGIVSDVHSAASHLEKKCATPGRVAICPRVRAALSGPIQAAFNVEQPSDVGVAYLLPERQDIIPGVFLTRQPQLLPTAVR